MQKIEKVLSEVQEEVIEEQIDVFDLMQKNDVLANMIVSITDKATKKGYRSGYKEGANNAEFDRKFSFWMIVILAVTGWAAFLAQVT